MRKRRHVAWWTIAAFGTAVAVLVAAGGLAWANRCPEQGKGWHLVGHNTECFWEGYAWSQHADNCHGNHSHTGETGFEATAFEFAGRATLWFLDEPGVWTGGSHPVDGNLHPFTVILATPFFDGKACLKATSERIGAVNGNPVFCDTVSMAKPWHATKLLNDGGNFRIMCGGGMAVRHDDYHDVDNGQATEHRKVARVNQTQNSQMEGPFDGCGALCMVDKRGGAVKYVLDEQGDIALDGDGAPQLDRDANGDLQWDVPQHVTTRLTSSVRSNGDGTVTYLYVIENLTGDPIPFNVAQVPVSATATGWSGTVSANSSLQTSLTLDCGDQDVCSENSCLELQFDGATEVNESVGGEIYLPENLLESPATCVISSITRSGLPARDHVTVLLSGGNAEDIFLFRQTATGVDCVGEMHGAYVADQSYTVDSEDAPPGVVTYFVSVGKGVNKYNSETSVLENP